MTKTYLEMLELKTFEERFEYLKLNGRVGEETFGYDRYLNQILYTSGEWRKFRRDIILRDNGLDLGCEGFSIFGPIIVHHINPITLADVENRSPVIFDKNNVVSTSDRTHKALHYGQLDMSIFTFADRKPNDTCPWKR